MNDIKELRKDFKIIRNEYIKNHPYCEYCGKPIMAEHVHHIIPLVKGGDNREVNLIALCGNCHSKIHGTNLNYKELQRDGIEIAKAQGKYKGRQAIEINKKFIKYYNKYLNKELNKTQLAKELNISRPTLDKKIKEYNKKINNI